MPTIQNKYSQKRNCAVSVPISKIHLYVSDLYIPAFDLPILLDENCGPILGIYKNVHRHMNVEIGTETAQIPEKEYINGIFLAVALGLGNPSVPPPGCRHSATPSQKKSDNSWAGILRRVMGKKTIPGNE
jgi:hypothetical protein